MDQAIQVNTARCTPELSLEACSNPAVARCISAWEIIFKAELAKGRHKVTASRAAAEPYRNAMPPLSGYENIRDFIACTAQGVLIGAIDATEASRLLYAAQVALGAFNRQPSKKNTKTL